MARLWLVTDATRLPRPEAAARALPRNSAVLARDLDPEALESLARLCRARRLQLVVSGDGALALRYGAGLHLPDRRAATGVLRFLHARCGRGAAQAPLSVAAHGARGLARARRLRADAVLLSPVFPTASHPSAPALGLGRWLALARRAACPVVALGGVDARGARRLPHWVAGVAALEGLLPARHSVSQMSRENVTSHCRSGTG